MLSRGVIAMMQSARSQPDPSESPYPSESNDMTGAALPLILASGSRSRRQMLEAAGLTFEVVPSSVDERAIREALEGGSDALDPADVAEVLARAKAEDVSRARPDALVIGADQVLALGETIYEKPGDLAEARRHIWSFRGQTHALHSAVALAIGGETDWALTDSAQMTMRTFSPAFADAYVDRAGPVICQSVGAYQLEGLGLQLFERVEGDYFTILGLPLLALLEELRNRGVIQS